MSNSPFTPLRATIDLRDPAARKLLTDHPSASVFSLTVIGEDGMVEHVHFSVSERAQPAEKPLRLRWSVEDGTHKPKTGHVDPWFRAEPEALANFLTWHDPTGARTKEPPRPSGELRRGSMVRFVGEGPARAAGLLGAITSDPEDGRASVLWQGSMSPAEERLSDLAPAVRDTDENPFPVRMMPGEEPYNPEELRKVEELVSDAAEGDPGEGNEPR